MMTATEWRTLSRTLTFNGDSCTSDGGVTAFVEHKPFGTPVREVKMKILMEVTEHPGLDAEEIADRLGLDIGLAVDLTNEMISKGHLGT